MIVIGEKLNSSIPKTMKAYEAWDEEYLLSLINNMSEHGADYIDINTALCEDEVAAMKKMIDLVCANSDAGVVIDSPDVEVLKECASYVENGRKIMLNSINSVDDMTALLPILKERDASCICMLSHSTIEERLDFASKLVEIADKEGISREKLFFDIAVQSAATDSESALLSLATIKAVKEKFDGVKTTCGLSNASFGLPKRININSAYLTCAVYSGLDSAIMDNTNTTYEMTVKAAEVIAGRDEYCMEYITYIRENQ